MLKTLNLLPALEVDVKMENSPKLLHISRSVILLLPLFLRNSFRFVVLRNYIKNSCFCEFFKHLVMQTVLCFKSKTQDWITQKYLGVHGNTLNLMSILSEQFGIMATVSKLKSTPTTGVDLLKSHRGNKLYPSSPPTANKKSKRCLLPSSSPDKHNEPLHFANDRRWDQCSTPAIDPACCAQCPSPIITATHSSIVPAPTVKG